MSEDKGDKMKHKIQEGALSGHKVKKRGKERGTSRHGERKVGKKQKRKWSYRGRAKLNKRSA
jgi:hypothetical protein